MCARTDEEHERLDPDAVDQEGLVDGVGLVLPDEPTERGHDVGVRIQLLLVHQLCFEDVQSLPQQEKGQQRVKPVRVRVRVRWCANEPARKNRA